MRKIERMTLYSNSESLTGENALYTVFRLYMNLNSRIASICTRVEELQLILKAG